MALWTATFGGNSYEHVTDDQWEPICRFWVLAGCPGEVIFKNEETGEEIKAVKPMDKISDKNFSIILDRLIRHINAIVVELKKLKDTEKQQCKNQTAKPMKT